MLDGHCSDAFTNIIRLGLFAKIRDRLFWLDPEYWVVVPETHVLLVVSADDDPVLDAVVDDVPDPDTTVGATVLGNVVDDAVFDVELVAPLVLGLST